MLRHDSDCHTDSVHAVHAGPDYTDILDVQGYMHVQMHSVTVCEISHQS